MPRPTFGRFLTAIFLIILVDIVSPKIIFGKCTTTIAQNFGQLLTILSGRQTTTKVYVQKRHLISLSLFHKEERGFFIRSYTRDTCTQRPELHHKQFSK